MKNNKSTKSLLSILILSVLGGCNSGVTSQPTPTTHNAVNHVDSSGVYKSAMTLHSNEEDLDTSFKYVVAQDDVAILTNNGTLVTSKESELVYVNSADYSYIPKDVIYLSKYNGDIAMGGKSGNVYYSDSKFKKVIKDNVGDATTSVYGVSKIEGKIFAVGFNGKVFLRDSVDGAEQDRKVINLGGSTLYSIVSDNTNKNIVAVGNSGTIWLSEDGGQHWNKKTAPGVTVNLYKAAYINGDFYAIGDSGTIIQSRDDGKTWTKYSFTDDIAGVHFKNIATVNDNGLYKIIVVGTNGTILNSNDNGRTWVQVNSGTKEHLSGVDCMTPKKDGVCYAVGPDTILRSLDHGSHWDHAATPRQLPKAKLQFDSLSTKCGVGGDVNTLRLTNSSEFIGEVHPNIAITFENFDVKLKTTECNLSASNPTCLVEYTRAECSRFNLKTEVSAIAGDGGKLATWRIQSYGI